MESLLVRVKKKGDSKKLSDILHQLSFVESVEMVNEKKLLREIEEGLLQVKAMQHGKLRKKTLDELLNEQ
ncbi:MAG TPA: hypothetical protein VE978_12560 [Chitinophagales bacterium]|nr:hypothetical protein [Chitinophagales bacterium]